MKVVCKMYETLKVTELKKKNILLWMQLDIHTTKLFLTATFG